MLKCFGHREITGTNSMKPCRRREYRSAAQNLTPDSAIAKRDVVLQFTRELKK